MLAVLNVFCTARRCLGTSLVRRLCASVFVLVILRTMGLFSTTFSIDTSGASISEGMKVLRKAGRFLRTSLARTLGASVFLIVTDLCKVEIWLVGEDNASKRLARVS